MPKAIKSEGIYKKKGSQYYHMVFRIDANKIVNRSTRMTTKAAAFEVFKRARERAIKESLGIFSGKTPRDVLSEWERMAQRKFGEKYIKAVKKSLDRHWLRLMDKKISKIRQDEVHRILVEIDQFGFAPESVNKAVNAFSCLITFAREELGWIKFVDFKFKRKEVVRKHKRVLSKGQVPVFLRLIAVQANLHATMIIALMLGLALREIEALYATWSKLGYDAKECLVFSTKGKNDKERRITVPDWLEVMILRYHEIVISGDYRPSRRAGRPRSNPLESQPRANSGTASAPQTDWMFPSNQGTPHRSGYTNSYIHKAGELMGINGLSAHRMRGTTANLLKLEGLSLDEIAKFLGHEHLSTTALYLEPSQTETHSAQNALGNQIWPGAASLARNMREKQAHLFGRSLLPPPPEALEHINEKYRDVDTSSTRLLPLSGPPPVDAALPVEGGSEAVRQSISASIQEISLKPGLIRPTKSLLVNLVWEIPSQRIGEIYGVSETMVGRWCEEFGIVKPERGFWSKVRALLEPVRRESARYAISKLQPTNKLAE